MDTLISRMLSESACTREEAIQIFEELEPVNTDFMLGRWVGQEIFTGHPMDGLLATTGWYGKIFESVEHVHPLVFYTSREKTDVFAINPTAIFAMQHQEMPAELFMADIRSQIETTDFKARLRNTEYRGVVSATMMYDELPINDIFKKIDDDTVFGVMDLKNQPHPYFFVLKRDK